MRICIDPGHGGTNKGCAYPPDAPELREEVYTLQFALDLADALRAKGHDVTLTRTEDKTTSFAERARVAKAFQADAVLSIHVNASTSAEPRGMRCYHMPGKTRAQRLGNDILARAPEELRHPMRPRRSEAASLDGRGDDAVLWRYEAPAVLVELGFASNDKDRAYLLSAAGRAEIVAGLQAAFF